MCQEACLSIQTENLRNLQATLEPLSTRLKQNQEEHLPQQRCLEQIDELKVRLERANLRASQLTKQLEDVRQATETVDQQLEKLAQDDALLESRLETVNADIKSKKSDLVEWNYCLRHISSKLLHEASDLLMPFLQSSASHSLPASSSTTAVINGQNESRPHSPNSEEQQQLDPLPFYPISLPNRTTNQEKNFELGVSALLLRLTAAILDQPLCSVPDLSNGLSRVRLTNPLDKDYNFSLPLYIDKTPCKTAIQLLNRDFYWLRRRLETVMAAEDAASPEQVEGDHVESSPDAASAPDNPPEEAIVKLRPPGLSSLRAKQVGGGNCEGSSTDFYNLPEEAVVEKRSPNLSSLPTRQVEGGDCEGSLDNPPEEAPVVKQRPPSLSSLRAELLE